MNKKVLVIGACALALAACTQKTASTTADEALAKRGGSDNQVRVSESPRASDSSAFVFNLNRISSASSSPSSSPRTNNSGKGSSNSGHDNGNSSGDNRLGKVTFREVGGKVTVSIAMENKAATASAEPAHIHVGACPEPGAVKYPLTSVVKGVSETTLPNGVTIESLKAMGPLAVNVHKSATELTKYVACGNLDFARGQDNRGGNGQDEIENENEHGSGSPEASHSPRPSKTPKASSSASASPAL